MSSYDEAGKSQGLSNFTNDRNLKHAFLLSIIHISPQPFVVHRNWSACLIDATPPPHPYRNPEHYRTFPKKCLVSSTNEERRRRTLSASRMSIRSARVAAKEAGITVGAVNQGHHFENQYRKIVWERQTHNIYSTKRERMYNRCY